MLNPTYDPRQDLADLEQHTRRLVRAAFAVVKNAKRTGDLLTESLLLELRDAADDVDAWIDD